MKVRNPEVVARYTKKYAASAKRRKVFENYVGISEDSELHGTIGRRRRAWQKEELDLLEDRSLTTREIAIKLNRSYYSVEHKRKRVKND